MSEMVTESRILLNRKDENEFMRQWCAFAAERGGRFSIKQEWVPSDWYTVFTIWWPANAEVPTALKRNLNEEAVVRTVNRMGAQ